MARPAPRPGRPVRGSRTGRPIMALLDLLGRRWVLRILWELREAGYGLTAQGLDLVKHLKPLNRWAEAWATEQTN